MFGLTKLNISDEQKRLAAYEELLGRYIAQEDIEEIVQKAREARKMQIKAGVRDGLQQYMLYQIQTGVQEWTTPTVIGARETYDALMAWDKINRTMLPFTRWQDFANSSNTKFGVNGWTVYAVWASYRGGWQIVIGSVSKDTKMTYYANSSSNPNNGNGYYPNGTSPTANYTNVVMNTPIAQGSAVTTPTWTIQSNTKIATNNNYYGYGMTYSNKSLYGTSVTRKATAQSAAITTALQNSSDIPLTASSQVVNGVLDTTGDIVATLPATLPQAASDIQDLPSVQEQLGVLPAPISQDIEQSITQLQEQQAAQYGDTGEYAIDLTQLFPFCLPFDIYRILVAFEAEPETPQIHFELVNPWSNGENAEKWEAELDLSRFDGVAALVRKLELLLYCVGLAMITRSVFLRG